MIVALTELSFIPMSFLFHKKTKKAIGIVWGVIAIIITVSMIFAYSGGGAIF